MQYYESSAYGEWCKRVYGEDLKQMGMVTADELELFYQAANTRPGSRLLDMGCGPGYLSAAVADHFGCHVTGVDLDEGAITHARNTFPNCPLLNFQRADGNQISFEAATFDLIYFFDTLYFTGSIEKLNTLLDKSLTQIKPGGQLAMFWSNHPAAWFGTQQPTASTTPVGLWASGKPGLVKAVDLTQPYRRFWLKAMQEIVALAPELRDEIPETYAMIFDECARFSTLCAQGDSGGMFRWFYMFTRA